ncbi:hypothetical protein [Thermomonospora umbrina]|uniref:Uncharacterized protein n=1 Tax=Thermomonospora umbrina TaxID=111806 RepID=A0A3D9SN02_9ACTN|nr:hypothetical protein [Thermomonospora umbrina]REE97306.1 hypothetical protein DFJ69_2773 [Thermomonospora umbrina]
MRTTTSRMLGFAAAVAIPAGAFLPWYGDVQASEFPLEDLFAGTDGATTGTAASAAMLLLATGVVALVAVLARSRLTAWPAVLGTLAIQILWIVMNALHFDPVPFESTDFRVGFWVTFAGTVGLLVAAVLPGDRPRCDCAPAVRS